MASESAHDDDDNIDSGIGAAVARSKKVSPEGPIGSNAFGSPIREDLPPASTIPGIFSIFESERRVTRAARDYYRISA
jgi:hypothetical protein